MILGDLIQPIIYLKSVAFEGGERKGMENDPKNLFEFGNMTGISIIST